MKRSVKAIALAMASLLAVTAVAPATVNAYWDEYGNWIDDDDDDEALAALIYGLAVADALDQGYASVSSYDGYYDSYLYDPTYYDTSDYYTYATTYIYYDDSDTYVGNDYYYGSIFYNRKIGYYYYSGSSIVSLGYNFTLRTKPNNTLTTVTKIATSDPAIDAGLGFAMPKYNISGYYLNAYRIVGFAFENEYKNSSGNHLYIRKAKGYNDISGDNADYTMTKLWKVNGTEVTIKGFKKSDHYLAVWTRNGYTYSVRLDDPLTLKQIQRIVRACM